MSEKNVLQFNIVLRGLAEHAIFYKKAEYSRKDSIFFSSKIKDTTAEYRFFFICVTITCSTVVCA